MSNSIPTISLEKCHRTSIPLTARITANISPSKTNIKFERFQLQDKLLENQLERQLSGVVMALNGFQSLSTNPNGAIWKIKD